MDALFHGRNRGKQKAEEILWDKVWRWAVWFHTRTRRGPKGYTQNTWVKLTLSVHTHLHVHHNLQVKTFRFVPCLARSRARVRERHWEKTLIPFYFLSLPRRFWASRELDVPHWHGGGMSFWLLQLADHVEWEARCFVLTCPGLFWHAIYETTTQDY